ncbi:hypothetical protein C8J56DRAFT_932532 [Mycena floridula]|nr:hypothetical protein C8J56DRAFT_932532 [Mycena floridula]
MHKAAPTALVVVGIKNQRPSVSAARRTSTAFVKALDLTSLEIQQGLLQDAPYQPVWKLSECPVDSGVEPTNLKSCVGCLTVVYCSPTCQKSDWTLHQAQCNLLALARRQNRGDSFPFRDLERSPNVCSEQTLRCFPSIPPPLPPLDREISCKYWDGPQRH